MSGGAGADTFIFAAGDTTPDGGLWDVITDFETADKLDFANTGTVYNEITATDAVDAVAKATARIAAGDDVVAVQVGSDVIVFVDSGNNDGVADDAVALIGRTLADISASNFI
jgi:hypothetical protein